MAVTWLAPTDLGVATAGSWVDVDVSAYVPAGATGVILHINNTGAVYEVGLRKKGSTDDRHRDFNNGDAHMWAAVGVDSNRVFQAWIESAAMDIYLVGYTNDEAAFFDNAVGKTLGTTDAWIDVDISADTGANTAIGVILEIHNAGSSNYNFGVRKNGSADNWVYLILAAGVTWAFIGVDESEIFEFNVSNANVKAYVVGYFTKDVVFNANAPDYSLSSTGGYYDLTALPEGATGAFIQVCGPSQTRTYALRKNGSSETIYGYVSRQCWAAVECDESRIIEGRIDSTAGKFYLSGYTLGDGEPQPGGGKRRFAQFI